MKHTTLLALSLSLGVSATALAANPVQKLPPKKKNAPQSEALGESRAVQEARRLNEKTQNLESTDTSGAVPSIAISSDVVQTIQVDQNTQSTTVETKTTTAAKPIVNENKVDVQEADSVRKAADLPQSKLWFVLPKKPELGFLAGWAFTRKELSTLVGRGFSYGFLAAQEITPGVQGQIRLSGSHHRVKNDTRTSSLNIFPFEVLGQFAHDTGPVSFYLQPGLGAAFWKTKSERLVDRRVQDANGFDFMASAGIGFKLSLPQSPWRLGADASMAYVSGYFDNYFSRILVYTTYQF